jgi:hypothetical protein
MTMTTTTLCSRTVDLVTSSEAAHFLCYPSLFFMCELVARARLGEVEATEDAPHGPIQR